MDFDTAGAGVPGALVGGAIERPTGHGGEAHNVCADCGGELIGRFCHQCGQPARIWRTLPLLTFRPGRLTREWVHGKRSRYVSPLATFLFAIFLMFMLLSMLPKPPEQTLGQARSEKAAEAIRDAARVSRLERELSVVAAAERTEKQAELDEARAELAKTKDELRGMDEAVKLGVPDGDWKAQVSERAKQGGLNVNIGDDKLNKKIAEKLENPELAIYKLQQTFYKFSFLLVPISIPFVALLFLWKRGFTLYDHGVFVLYSLTFMTVLITTAAVSARFDVLAGLIMGAIPFVAPAHMYFQLKGAYGLSWFSALWRTFLLLVFCLITVLLFFLAIIWLGFG
jgi:hypothetical protein